MSADRRWLLLWIVLATFVVARATARPDHRGVLLDHLEFGRRLLHGDDVYADWRVDPDAPLRPLHAPYPPSFGLLTAPFAVLADGLGLRAARAAWALLQVGAAVALALALRSLLRRTVDPPALAEQRWLLLGSLVLLARFLLRDLHGGGGNLVNIALCTCSFAAAERSAPRRSGWLLGCSLATKPTQVWLLPLFLAMGHRRAVLHALLALSACALASLLLLRCDAGPWQRWLQGSLALGAQSDAFAVPALGFPEFEWMNQSLRCGVARWFSSVPAPYAARVALGVAPPGLGLPPVAAAWITRLSIGGGLVALLAVAARRRSPLARVHLFGAALVLSLAASPLSWKAHHLALLPVVHLLLRQAVRSRSRAAWLLLGTFAITCGIGQQLVGDDVDEWLNSLYVLPAFDVLLFTWALRQARIGDADTSAGAARRNATDRPC